MVGVLHKLFIVVLGVVCVAALSFAQTQPPIGGVSGLPGGPVGGGANGTGPTSFPGGAGNGTGGANGTGGPAQDIVLSQGGFTYQHGGIGAGPEDWLLQSSSAFKLFVFDGNTAWYDENELTNRGFPLSFNYREDDSGVTYVLPYPRSVQPPLQGEFYHSADMPYRIEDLDINVQNITNFCSAGVEGQYESYYVTFPKAEAGSVNPSDPLNSGIPDPNVQRIAWSPIHIVDWDANPEKYCSQTCVNINSTLSPEYNKNAVDVAYTSGLGFCCGDDINATTASPQGPDCGRIANGQACLGTNLDPAGATFTLLPQTAIGKVQPSACGGIEVATDGAVWYRCGEFDPSVSAATANTEFTPLRTALFNNGTTQHGIICEQTNNVMYECVNTTETKLHQNNNEKEVGESVLNVSGEASANTTYYCTEQNTWIKDLDSPLYAQACDAAGFDWTGDMCCSEQEDTNEFYNDPIQNITLATSPGACWNATYVREGEHPLNTTGMYKQDLIVINGTFLACDTNAYQHLVNENPETIPTLVANEPVCSLQTDVNIGNKFFCNVQNGLWETLTSIPTDGGVIDPYLVDAMHMSDSEEVQPGMGTQACCPVGDCWNGSVCVGNQAGIIGGRTYNDLRCENGDWVEARQKWRWDLTVPGFCPNPDTQCLVDQTVGCVDQYTAVCDNGNCDYYCAPGGEWSTRTKYLAQQMKVFAESLGGNYDLYCDTDIEVVSNFVEYELQEVFPSAPAGVYAEDLLGSHCTVNGTADQPCVASMCALKYNGGIAVGITTNIDDITDVAESPFRLFGETQSVCSQGAQAASAGSGAFERCGSSNLWFNEVTRSIISIPQGSVPPRTVIQLKDGYNQFFVDTLYNPFMQQLPQGFEQEFDFLDQASIMHALFFAHRQSNDVHAYYEGPRRYDILYQSHIGMSLPGAVQDPEMMCRYLSERSTTPVVCNPPDEYYVVHDDDFVTQFKNDVMGKLRVP